MTAQFHEKLVLEGKETSMASCPPMPTDHPHIKKLSDDEIHFKISNGKIDTFVFSTACWRQYIGKWELKQGKLYLVEVRGRYFYDGRKRIFADWVDCVIHIPDGELLEYVHMGFESIYQYENHIKIEGGIVVDERRVDNRHKFYNANDLPYGNLPNNDATNDATDENEDSD